MKEGSIAQVKPSVSSIIADMHQFIDNAQAKAQFDRSAYEHIHNTLGSIELRVSQVSSKSGGALQPDDEANIRRQLDLLSADIARLLNP